MEKEPMFKIGEKVKPIFGDEIGYVLEITLRPKGYEERYEYLVEYEKSGWFGKRKKQKWEFEGMLNKFLPPIVEKDGEVTNI